MGKKVLVLTNSKDGINSESVIGKVEERGMEVFRYDSDQLTPGGLAVKFSLENGGSFEINHPMGGSIIRQEVGSAWYRRPSQIDYSTQNPSLNRALRAETRAVQEGMWASLPDNTWFNSPKNMELASKKLGQLREAQALGFQVPDTIATNDPQTFLEFLERHKQVIVKPLVSDHFESAEGLRVFYSTLITLDNHPDSALIANAPCFLQEYIKKEKEYRVTVVDQDVFVAEVLTEPEAKDDWRKHQFSDKVVFAESNDLDSATIQKCLKLMTRFNLRYATFDLIRRNDHEVVFLEMNPNGQWYWLEHQLGFPVSDRIANSLVGICQQNS